jgi:hypothetical protein
LDLSEVDLLKPLKEALIGESRSEAQASLAPRAVVRLCAAAVLVPREKDPGDIGRKRRWRTKNRN